MAKNGLERLYMSLGVNRISFAGTEPPRPSQVTTAGGASRTQLLKQNGLKDTVTFRGENDDEQGSKLTDDERKELIRTARSKSSGCACLWSLLGLGWTSVLYYGLRSDNKVARKYGLDPQEDKKLVKTIKTQQMLWSLPAALPFVGILPGLVAWLYNKNMDSSGIDV